MLPAPNPFIPTDLSVDKEDVAEVNADGARDRHAINMDIPARQASDPDQTHRARAALAQEGRSVLDAEGGRAHCY